MTEAHRTSKTLVGIFDRAGDWASRYLPQPIFYALLVPVAVLLIIGFVVAWCVLSPDKWQEITR